ncbi:molybdenum cofactor sulfurase [Naviculisporaceae sp. PSN 640]
MDERGSVPLRSGPAIHASAIFLLLITLAVFLLPIFILFPPTPPSRSDAILQTHSRLGLQDSEKSGLASTTGSGPRPPKTSGLAKIQSLFIYPVKSCRGIELKRSKVLPSGLEYDRLFTFAQLKSPFPLGLDSSEAEQKSHEWEFITQRQFPLLATVQVDLYLPDIVKSRSTGVGSIYPSSEAFLILRFPWQEAGLRGTLGWLGAKLARGRKAVPEKEIMLPVTFPSEEEIKTQGYEYEEVRIWKDTVTALNMETELPRELRLYLGVSNRLGIFRIDPGRLREVHRCAPSKNDAGYQPVTGFQDAYPLHLLNLSSVRDFSDKVEKDDVLKTLDPRRFRANILIDGAEAYDEESWKTICFEPGPETSRRERAKFHVSCRTVRCKMPNVDPDSGIRHPVEPDRSLRKFRDVDEGAKLKGCLGMQMTPLFDKTDSPDDMESWVEVGMSVDVLDRGSHFYLKQ